MKVAIIGANGQLGMDLMRAFVDTNPISLTIDDVLVENYDIVSKVLSDIKPDLVINTAAYHKVDDCEKYPEPSFQVNAIGAFNVARVTESLKCKLVHISTDYVFDGNKQKPYVENDLPNPLNVYGISKLAGEHLVQAYSSRYYIVRTSGLYGHNKCLAKGTNFIESMLKLSKEKNELRVVQDEVLTPTYTFHLAKQIRELVKADSYGLYHITNNGFCSWFQFAKEIFKLAGVNISVVPISAKEFPSIVKRPPYSVLENSKLKSLGIDIMPDWKESLEHYFKNKPS